MPKVERCAWKYWLEAAPAVDLTCSYHANPHATFCLELFAVPTFSLCASRPIMCALMLGAVAVVSDARAFMHSAYLHQLGHQIARVGGRNVSSRQSLLGLLSPISCSKDVPLTLRLGSNAMTFIDGSASRRAWIVAPDMLPPETVGEPGGRRERGSWWARYAMAFDLFGSPQLRCGGVLFSPNTEGPSEWRAPLSIVVGENRVRSLELLSSVPRT